MRDDMQKATEVKIEQHVQSILWSVRQNGLSFEDAVKRQRATSIFGAKIWERITTLAQEKLEEKANV